MRFHAIMILGLLAISITGCGYQLAGRGQLPGGIQTLAVQVFDNRSSQTGAEAWITNAVIGELNRRRQGTVVAARDAQATLSGVIESLTWDTVSKKGLNTAAERRVYATVSLSLANLDGDILWQRSGLRDEQAYAVVEGDKLATENNRSEAIQDIFQRVAENVYRRLTDQF